MQFKEEIDKEVPKDDSTSMGEKMFLYWLIRELKPTTIVETGTHRGLTSLYMAHALFDNGKGHLWTCDPNAEWGAKGNFGKFPELNERITFIQEKGKNLNVSNIDFAFIDGFHGIADVIPEIQTIFPKLSKTAVVVFHDCWYGETEGVNEAVESMGLQTVWLPTTNAMRIFSKHPNAPTGPDVL